MCDYYTVLLQVVHTAWFHGPASRLVLVEDRPSFCAARMYLRSPTGERAHSKGQERDDEANKVPAGDRYM